MKYITIITLALMVSCSTSNQTPKKSKNKKAKPINSCVCMEIYRPVCASDGNTYANSCEADCLGLRYTDGECS